MNTVDLHNKFCLNQPKGVPKPCSTTPVGRLFFHMNAAFDQFQREIIVENTNAGLEAAKKRGRVGGRPKAMTDEKYG